MSEEKGKIQSKMNLENDKNENNEKHKNEILEKAIIKAIFKTGRVLVHRQELDLPEDYEDNDKYVFYNDDCSSDFDVLTLPDILQLDERELNIFREIFIIEEMDIDKVSEIIAKYAIRKQQTCTTSGHVYSLLLEKAKKYFSMEEDYSEYNEHRYAGKIKYVIKDGDTVLGTIVKNIEYCNRCIGDPRISIGIQKCTEYTIERM